MRGTLWFPQSRCASNHTTQSSATQIFTKHNKEGCDAYPEGRPSHLWYSPTTSFLTATILIYAFGAGITAAAGTRLALQLLVTKCLTINSFQLQNIIALYCYILSLPPCARIGKFARLLPSLDVVAVSQATSPESNPNSPSPVKVMVVHYTTIKLIGQKFEWTVHKGRGAFASPVTRTHHKNNCLVRTATLALKPNKVNLKYERVQSEFTTCISSRITTVIQAVLKHQINNCWYNEPSTVSQTNLFELRHAWLNPWGKHMTTGRINQVLISKSFPSG